MLLFSTSTIDDSLEGFHGSLKKKELLDPPIVHWHIHGKLYPWCKQLRNILHCDGRNVLHVKIGAGVTACGTGHWNTNAVLWHYLATDKRR